MAGINKRPMQSGTDWSRYTPFSEVATITPAVADTYETAYSVTGQGYLSSALIKNVSTGDAYIKITIDGVEVVEVYTINSFNVVGIFQENSVESDGSTTGTFLWSGHYSLSAHVTYPNTTPSLNSIKIATPIFFSTSLLIEIKQVTGNNIVFGSTGGYIA